MSLPIFIKIYSFLIQCYKTFEEKLKYSVSITDHNMKHIPVMHIIV